MTMQHPIHPDDERLSALTAADADALADAGLRAHVAACERCQPMLTELRQLHVALTELPDLVPSRRLQLLPPAPEQPARRGGWLRRLAAPLMVSGFALVLVGAVGGSGALNGALNGLELSGGAFAGAAATSAGDAEQQPADQASQAAAPGGEGLLGAENSRGAVASHKPRAQDSAAPQATDDRGVSRADGGAEQEPSPWLVLLLVGVGLLLAGIMFRLAPHAPRAGPAAGS